MLAAAPNALVSRDAVGNRRACVPHRLRVALVMVAAAVGALGAAGSARAWESVIDGTPGSTRPFGMAVDPSGDVLVAGRVDAGDAGDDGLLVKLAGADGAERWRWSVAGLANANDLIRAVSVDPDNGDVVVTGRVVDTETGANFLIARLSSTGSLLWSHALDGGAAGDEQGFAVGVTTGGDVIAAGRTVDEGGTRFTVLALARVDGAVLWRQDLVGSDASTTPVARALVLAGDGSVVVAGRIRNLETGDDIVVGKLDAATGAVAWRTELSGDGITEGGGGEEDDDEAGSADDAVGLAVGPSGRIVVVGHTANMDTGIDFTVAGLSAMGEERWRIVLDGTAEGDDDNDRALGVTVDDDGNAIAVGRLVNATTANDAVTIKLDGDSGALLWRRDADGSDGGADDEARAVGVDAAGDVAVAGRLRGTDTRRDLWVAKLAADDGAAHWQVAIDSGRERNDEAWTVAVDAAGDVVAAGRYRQGGDLPGLVVVKRSGPGGGSYPCGDGVLDASEECDDANAASGDGCRPDCTIERCGDGILDPQEGCDDGNTVDGDCCSAGCEALAEGAACDDGDACTGGDRCVAGACVSGAPLVCVPPSQCHIAFCDALANGCVSIPKVTGLGCDDGDPCTLTDFCRDGTCVGGAPRVCTDGDPCTQDACDPANGCVHLPHTDFRSVSCLFESGFASESCPLAEFPVPRQLERRVDRVQTLVTKAGAAGATRRAKRLLKRAARKARAAVRLAGKLGRREKLSVGCVAAFEERLGDLQTRAERLWETL